MPIIFKVGDIFSDNSQAIVNTVNCVGVMGKGIALEVKKRFPDCFNAYRDDCSKGLVKVGQVTTYENSSLFGGMKYIINFPTKKHWFNPSEIQWIKSGLSALRIEIYRLKLKSIAIPPLGCGCGGLNWNEVKSLIIEKLSDIDNVDITIYEPK